MKVDKNYYPGFVRRAITFTIDDGNLALDERFISIVKPHGIKGTFNLCMPKDGYTADFYRELYSGFGIANHCKLHPLALDPDVEYRISDEKFDKDTADVNFLYKSDIEGYYHYSLGPDRWRYISDYKTYIKFVDECKAALAEIFGEENIKGFVWPFFQQKDERILEYLISRGYGSVRKTGTLRDTTGFSLPADRFRWSYNATDKELLEVAELYERYEDDGELKFFCFGLHSHDYQNNDTWGELERFAEKYGDRPDTYWYATVDEIFDYEDAVRALCERDGELLNDSDVDLYVKVDGECVVVPARGKYSLI